MLKLKWSYTLLSILLVRTVPVDGKNHTVSHWSYFCSLFDKYVETYNVVVE